MKKFKNYTSEEIQVATRMAYEFAFSMEHIMFSRPFKYDARTRIGNLAAEVFANIKIDRAAILNKWKQRRANRYAFTNVLQNPLVKDYMKNRPTEIYPDHLHFNGRNHWAKNVQDRKILSILSK